MGIAVVVVAVGAIAAGTLLQANPAPEPPGPGPVATTVPTAESSPAPADWAPLDLPPLLAVATLEPTARDDAGIPADATFTLAA
jgi:hypothetical protein